MSFSLDIAKFAQKALGNADIVVRKTVLDLGTSLVERTPVGDATLWKRPENKPPGYVGGHARANWSHSIGAQSIKEFKAVDDSAAENNISMRRIARSLGKERRSGQTAVDNVHFIQNSVPYIVALEDGHSTQAPHGMVALATLEFQSIIRGAVGGLK
ncbi:MAG: hypothetical protein JRC86_00420 [Deltaproteobacteria bacterium]|nr:hypothetical protein [Deltaproteobacteria bacterium]